MKALTLLSAGAILAGIAIPAALASSVYTCTVFKPSINVTGINNKGQVIGSRYDANQIPHAVLRNADGTLTTLISPRGSDQFTPAGINNLGQIAGQIVTNMFPFTVSESFILNPDGSHIDIAPAVAPPGHTYGPPQITGINDKGELDGTILFDGFDVFLIFIRDSNGHYSIIDQIANGNGLALVGTINDSDVILQYGAGSGYDGFLLHRDGSSTTLSYPGVPPRSQPQPTVTNGLNSHNVTAGDLDATFDGGIATAFLRTLDGHYPSVVCPDALTAKLDVVAINDNNVVVGYITPPAGSGGAFIATPTGISPQAELSNTSWTFASHGLGETSGIGRIFLSNTGAADLHIPTMHIGPTGQTSDNVSYFQITNTNCGQRNPDAQVAPGTVAPGASCFVEFTFTPRSPGWQTAALYISTDSPDSPQIIQLGGTGIASTMQVSNRSWTFAAHAVGETSGNGVIYPYNAGPAVITFQDVHVFEPGGQSDFNLINNTCGSLAPFTTCAVTFNFTPKTPGDHAATLSIVNDSINGPNHIPLRGHGN